MAVRASIDSKGRLFIPSEIRKETGLGERESVVVQAVGPGEFKVTGVKHLVARSVGMYRHLRRDDESVADELIEERRREARSDLNDKARS
jgi:bifunctional DNA-binding transcriptional regulator/antitoxin component of YhaV-PrlF toxin-antitoxin module